MEKNDAFFKTYPIVWGITIVGGALLWILGEKSWGLSFILGNVTSMMMMSMLYRQSKRVLESDKQTAQRLATRNYFFRYAFYAIVLAASAFLSTLNVLFTAVGIFVFKAVFYVVLHIDGRGEVK